MARLCITEDSVSFTTNVRLNNPLDYACSKYRVYQGLHKKRRHMNLKFKNAFYVTVKARRKLAQRSSSKKRITLQPQDEIAKIICYGFMGNPLRYCNWAKARSLWHDKSPTEAFNYVYQCYRWLNLDDCFSDYRFYSYKKQDPLWRTLCDKFKMRTHHQARYMWTLHWGDVCNSLFSHFYQKVIVERRLTSEMYDALSRNDILFLFLLFFNRYSQHATRHLITSSRDHNNTSYKLLREVTSDSNNYELFEEEDLVSVVEALRTKQRESLSEINWCNEKLEPVSYQ